MSVGIDVNDAVEAFVSVPEAARQLGVTERRAYRHAAKLSDSDRHVTDSGKATVRLSALTARLRQTEGIGVVTHEKEGPTKNGSDASDGDSIDRPTLTDEILPSVRQKNGVSVALPDSQRRNGKHPARVVKVRVKDTRVEEELRARLEDRRAEIERLGRLADQAQQLQLAAMSEVQALQRRAVELEAANARLVQALPAAESSPTADSLMDTNLTQTSEQTKPRRWWQWGNR